MIDGFATYLIYTGVKNHFFTKSYDYWRYNRKVNVTKESFERRTDKGFFYVVGKNFNNKQELELFFIGNFKINNKLHISELTDSESQTNYRNHNKIVDSLVWHTAQDVNYINNQMQDDNKYIISAKIFRDVYRNKINLETLCLLDVFYKLFTYYEKKARDTLYLDNKLFLCKYSLYLGYTVSKEILRKLNEKYNKNFI